MRYELTDFEWAAIKPMLPNKPRGVPRIDDRRVLNGIFWVLRSGAPWRDLPQGFGPYTTCYNRFARWRRAGVWNRIMEAVAAAHDAAVQMIDTSIVRVHQHAACTARNKKQSIGRSRGGLSSKIHAVVDKNGLPVRLALTAGEAHDNRLATKLLSRLKSGAMLLADRGYDADWIRALVRQHDAWANIPHGEIEKTHFALVRTYTALVIWSNGSSIRSNSAGVWRPATTNSQPTTSHSSSLPQYGCGYVFMSTGPSPLEKLHRRKNGARQGATGKGTPGPPHRTGPSKTKRDRKARSMRRERWGKIEIRRAGRCRTSGVR
jgi:transposase